MYVDRFDDCISILEETVKLDNGYRCYIQNWD